MRAFLVISCVCFAAARPQFEGYNYELANYQHHGLGIQQQQQDQSQFSLAPLVQQSQTFETSGHLPSQPIQTYSSQEEFFPALSTASVPSTFQQIALSFQDSYAQQDHSSHPQQNIISISFNGLTELQSQPFQNNHSSAKLDQTQTSNEAVDFTQLQQSQSTQTFSDSTAGTLDSFKIYSTFGPNPADIAPNTSQPLDNGDATFLEAPPPNIQPTVQQSIPFQAPKNARHQIAPETLLHQQPQTETIQKHIYLHVPPKELEMTEESLSTPVVANKNKHYNIIFIKTSTNSRPSFIPQLPQNEDKTIIYVLVKKPDEIRNIQPLAEGEDKNNKPEVYFIKYKTEKHHFGATTGQLEQQSPLDPEQNESKKLSHAPQFPTLEQGEDVLTEEQQPAKADSTQNHYLPPN